MADPLGEPSKDALAGTADDAKHAVAEALGKHARPARLILVDEIATLASGKPDREAIRRIAAELR